MHLIDVPDRFSIKNKVTDSIGVETVDDFDRKLTRKNNISWKNSNNYLKAFRKKTSNLMLTSSV
jgi:4-diphosphocytidyl-2C-methyl-D-erythritol kinase